MQFASIDAEATFSECLSTLDTLLDIKPDDVPREKKQYSNLQHECYFFNRYQIRQKVASTIRMVNKACSLRTAARARGQKPLRQPGQQITTMSTVHFSQITEPELLDIVDDAWLQDKLPDDSEQLGLPVLFACGCQPNMHFAEQHCQHALLRLFQPVRCLHPATWINMVTMMGFVCCRCAFASGHAWVHRGA